MLSNLKDVVKKASENNYSIIGFNVFGYEDAKAVIKAGEELNRPVLLMLNKLSVEYMSVERWASLLIPMAEEAKVPVSVHLDHCKNFDLVIRAINSGFTSVMYDGSQLSLEENIRRTKEVAKVAKIFDVVVEGEIGSVPYADVNHEIKDIYTTPEEAKRFAEESGVDWVAVAVGQVHRLQSKSSEIQFNRLKMIEEVVEKPLVIHGGSGIKIEDLEGIKNSKVGKMNFGTSLRVAFGETLKKEIEKNPKEFDRINLFKEPTNAVVKAAKEIIKSVN